MTLPTDSYVHRIEPGTDDGPLLFLLHGTGGDQDQLVPLGRALMPDATLVSPLGDISEHGAPRFFRRTGEGIYDMADLARATGKMADFLAAHTERNPGRPVHALGYSNGANILASVLFERPKLFDRLVLMHPLIPFEPAIDAAIEGRRVLITAGQRDPICPPQLTEQLTKILRRAGADVSVNWHDGGHELRPDEIQAARIFLNA